MTREDNPEYFAHVCGVIKAVFMAEQECENKYGISKKVKTGEITADQYVEFVAEELIGPTDKNEIEDF